MRIALDAMGGDFGAPPNVDGALAALAAHSDLEIDLVGDRPVLEDLLSKAGFSGSRMRMVPSEGVAEMGEKPTEALLKKPNCSIAICWKLLASKETDALVSAGSTGAVVGAGLRIKLFLKGVKRPGIAVPMPTTRALELESPAARGRSLANARSSPRSAPGKLRAKRRATTCTYDAHPFSAPSPSPGSITVLAS